MSANSSAKWSLKQLSIVVLVIFSGFLLNAQQGTIQKWKTVRLILEDQFDIKAFRDSLVNSGIAVTERPAKVIQRLQSVRQPVQKAFDNYIAQYEQKYPGSSGNLSFSYLVNLAVIDVSEALFHDILKSGFVKELVDERFSPVLIAPVEQIADVSRQMNGHEPGLSVIGAPFMWKLGYTGAGRLVYSIDTGVWPEHPALKKQWSGNYFPMSWCWKSFDRIEPGDKSDSHGTHVNGITLGLDNLMQDTIGVAFNARFIAADPIAESVAGIKTLEVLVGAFEFALNPDGNIETADDVPDVITNSWGVPWFDSLVCSLSLVTDMFSALDAAGIAVEFSAGNEGPAASTIGLPQYVSIDTLLIFTVGAIDGRFENGPFPIAEFSSRGPTKCTDAPENSPLRIKPEVVAPGYQVRSSVGLNQYSYMSGTSMAGPHVSGAIALLKEAFPMLDGRSLLNALYQTATDLGTEGEDNTYGRGLINLEAAYNFLAAKHTPVPPIKSDYDLSIENIILPNAACKGKADIKVVLKNTGKLPINASSIKLRNNLIQVQEKKLNYSLLPGERDTILFHDFELYALKNEFFATVYSDESIVEMSTVNNNFTRVLHVSDTRTLPYAEDFENSNISGNGRLLFNPDNQQTWDTTRTGGLPSGKYSAQMRFIGYTPRTGQVDELRLPQLQIPEEASKLIFRLDYAYRYRNGYNDSLEIEVSTDCGQTWPISLFSKGGIALATVDTNWAQFVPSKYSHWDSLHFELDSLIPYQNLLVRFRSINHGGSRLYIDNILINTDLIPKVSTESVLKVFPNPVTETLTVEPGNIALHAKITVSDINGRILLIQNIPDGSTAIQIPMGSWAAGIYFLSIDNPQGKTVGRFIKQ